MPSWKPVALTLVALAAAIWLAFPDYVALQSSSSTGRFLGVLADDDVRASIAVGFDLMFSVAYAVLGFVAFAAVAAGVPRFIGSAAIIAAAVADEVENVMVLVNIGSGVGIDASNVDLMVTAGGIKWGLLVTSVVLFLALSGHRWLESRRA